MVATHEQAPSFNELVRWLSAERLDPYVDACVDDQTRAMHLYQWNAAVASAFFEALGHFEVIFRNALHVQLTSWHHRRQLTGEWYDDPAKVLSQHRRDDILAARQRLHAKGKPDAPGRVVAELSLGFWRFLLDQRHHQILWAQALNRAFPEMPKRKRTEVQRRVNRLHLLRNRIAHHEPIHGHDLATRYSELIQVVNWIDPAAAQWLTRTCRRLLLRHRP